MEKMFEARWQLSEIENKLYHAQIATAWCH